jgi:hypothetical protein
MTPIACIDTLRFLDSCPLPGKYIHLIHIFSDIHPRVSRVSTIPRVRLFESFKEPKTYTRRTRQPTLPRTVVQEGAQPLAGARLRHGSMFQTPVSGVIATFLATRKAH